MFTQSTKFNRYNDGMSYENKENKEKTWRIANHSSEVIS